MPCNPKVTGWASGVPSMSSETVVVIFLAIWLTIQSGQTTLRNARRKKDSLTRCSLSCEDAPTKPAAARGSARSRRIGSGGDDALRHDLVHPGLRGLGSIPGA